MPYGLNHENHYCGHCRGYGCSCPDAPVYREPSYGRRPSSLPQPREEDAEAFRVHIRGCAACATNARPPDRAAILASYGGKLPSGWDDFSPTERECCREGRRLLRIAVP